MARHAEPTPAAALQKLERTALSKYTSGAITKAQFDKALKLLREFVKCTKGKAK